MEAVRMNGGLVPRLRLWMFEKELLMSGNEEGDLDQESEHLVQGCADPRVIEFPRDARTRERFRCAAAFRASCGSCVPWRRGRKDRCRILVWTLM